MVFDTKAKSSQVKITKLGSPTVDQVQEYLDYIGSSGWFEGGEITDSGSGAIDIAAGKGFIRATDSNVGTFVA